VHPCTSEAARSAGEGDSRERYSDLRPLTLPSPQGEGTMIGGTGRLCCYLPLDFILTCRLCRLACRVFAAYLPRGLPAASAACCLGLDLPTMSACLPRLRLTCREACVPTQLGLLPWFCSDLPTMSACLPRLQLAA
jgi:hypothetical protein